MANLNIYLPPKQSQLIEGQMKEENNANASDVLHTEFSQIKEYRLQALREAVLHGINSGVAEGDVIGRVRKRIKERAAAK